MIEQVKPHHGDSGALPWVCYTARLTKRCARRAKQVKIRQRFARLPPKFLVIQSSGMYLSDNQPSPSKPNREGVMRAKSVCLFLGFVLLAGATSAYDAEDPNNCNGVDWADKRALIVSKVTGGARVNFIKSPYDDDFTAASCPADTDLCRRKSYLVPGDLVLTGRTRGAFTCVIYQSPLAKKQVWARGWLPSSALTPVAPMPSPKTEDWIGTWYHPGGEINIARGDAGKLHVAGEMTVPTARDFHNGQFEAQVTPQNDTIAFVDDGSVPFDKTDEDGCRVRMQRIGPWLMVEDNDSCGGAGVSFIGLYRRKK
jgi:hypothetical protein